jgi:hypothetical protein
MPLLPALGEKYPGGCTWLERRLYDVSAGRAFLLAAHFGGAVAALAIETPKGLHIRKLSTFVVLEAAGFWHGFTDEFAAQLASKGDRLRLCNDRPQ